MTAAPNLVAAPARSRPRRRWLSGCFVALAGLGLAAWFLLVWRQGPFTALVNTGQVCLRPGADAATVLASFSPGCYSGTCTVPLYRSASAAVDPEQRLLRFTARFVLRRLDFPRGSQPCDGSCGGGGKVEWTVEDLEPGLYTVYIGSQRAGQLPVPITAESLCFDDRPPFPAGVPGTSPAPASPAANGAGSPLAPPATATLPPYPVQSPTPFVYPAPELSATAAAPTATARAYPPP